MPEPAEPPPENPLRDDDPLAWDRLIASVSPPSLLVVIDGWLGPQVRRLHTAEDVWQETLLMAWQERARCEWRGLPAFRRWLLEVARHRVHDLADRNGAQKRGHGRERPLADHVDPATSSAGTYAGPVAATTPSRTASDREQKERFAAALLAVPADHREVVRLRLFEGLRLPEVAERLGLSLDAVKYRFHEGSLRYRDELLRAGSTGTALGRQA